MNRTRRELAAWRTVATGVRQARVILLVMGVLVCAPGSGWAQRAPTIVDEIGSAEITGAWLSPSGNALLYETVRADPATDAIERVVWHRSLTPLSPPQPVAVDLAPRAPQWRSDGRFSFLGASESGTQLYLSAEGTFTPVLDYPGAILSYQWASDGQRVAYTTFGESSSGESDTPTARRGIVVSKWDFIFYGLFGNIDFAQVDNRIELWVADLERGERTLVSGTMSAGDFAWSSSGECLAFTASPAAGLGVSRSDLYLRCRGQDTQLLLAGSGDEQSSPAVAYSQPVWSPDERRIALLRDDDLAPVLVVHTRATGHTEVVVGADSLDLYRPQVRWFAKDTLRIELTRHGQRGLFKLSLVDGQLVPVRHGRGEASLFDFSRDGSQAVWVGQAADRPPEVFSSTWPLRDERRVTHANQALDSVRFAPMRAVNWQGDDGAAVHGWLMLPHGYRHGSPVPLVTVVHGGPVFAVTDRFRPYPMWPYAFQAFSARGYAVFFPNYRGTGSYGRAFLQPSADDSEPVDDILAGVRYLVAEGIADSTRLGIIGHSHGAWIGPMAVTRFPEFGAASFAEGMADYAAAYTWVPGWHALRFYEPGAGNPFDNPERYRELSPMYNLGSTRTPTLIEVGQQSLALQGLAYATALWRYAIPHELVIYPATGHNISSPMLALDAARRNLAWFDFWLPGKRAQNVDNETLRRWEDMKAGKGFPPPLKPPG